MLLAEAIKCFRGSISPKIHVAVSLGYILELIFTYKIPISANTTYRAHCDLSTTQHQCADFLQKLFVAACVDWIQCNFKPLNLDFLEVTFQISAL